MPHTKRRGIRYHPPLADTCQLMTSLSAQSSPIPGLIHDESHRGCSILCVLATPPSRGDVIVVKVGNLFPMQACVTYALSPAPDLQHIGCEYLGDAVNGFTLGAD